MTLDSFLLAYGSALILPLAIVEGPVVSVATGFLTAQGDFAWYCALPLLIAGDLIGDVIYYWIGHSPLSFLGRRFGIAGRVTPALQQDLRQNTTKMLLLGKWTHAIGGVVLIASGMLRLPLRQFMLVNLLATIPKSTVLFGIGYFAGDHFPFIERHYPLVIIVLAIGGLTAAALVLRRPENPARR